MDNQVIFGDSDKQQNQQEESQQKVASSRSISPQIVNLVDQYKAGLEEQGKGGIVTIHVDEIASKVARFYEKIRKVIDWKEENVLRRSAILRILKRSLISKITNISFTSGLNVNKIAESLTFELIRGGHLPNDEVPEQKIEVVAQVLKKYLFILENASYSLNGTDLLIKKKINFYDWLLEIAACEIEEVLALPFKENALIKAMTILMNERIRVISEVSLNEEEKKTLTYIAVCRTLFDLDDAFIAYHILTHRYPHWTNPSNEFLTQLTQYIFTIQEEMVKKLKHPLSRNFFNICERLDTIFTLLGDLLDFYQKEPDKIVPVLSNKERLKELITQFYDKRLKTLKVRLFRTAIYSSLSVFVSNWFTFFVVEVPIANLFYEGFSLTAAIIDFLLPALFMFFLVAIIKPPAGDNLEKVTEMFFKFVYQEKDKDVFEIKTRKKKRSFIHLLIVLFYIVGCIVSFGFIAWIFYIAKIPVTSVILDTIMIALNVFAALVIRNKSRELSVQEKAPFWEFFLDTLSVPVAEVGSYLANKWKEYNVVSIFFSVLVEMPFLAVVDVIENWSQFIKERKADIH